MTPVRVLVVDDSTFVRRALSRVLRSEPGIMLVGEAEDGESALSLARVLSPDVVLLDLGLPERDGLSVLAELKARAPHVAVVVVAANAGPTSERGARALALGAFCCLDKSSVSSMELHTLGAELVLAIREAGQGSRDARGEAPDHLPEVLVVGASTGGPAALQQLREGLGSDFPAPVVMVQHMPAGILPQLATRLSAELPESGTRLSAGRFYLAPGGQDACLVRAGAHLRLVSRAAAPGSAHVPGVDPLFHSAAAVCGASAWGVLLTGMGRDGALGLGAIRAAGGLTVAQDAASSAVWGMPRAAFELRAARYILALESIAPFLRSAALAGESTGPARAHLTEESSCR